jgi:hypothetical protein
LRDTVVIVASHVVANCWFTVDCNNQLRSIFMGSEPFKWNWFIEKIAAVRDSGILTIHQGFSCERSISVGNDRCLTNVFVLTSILDKESNTVLAVGKVSTFDYFNLIRHYCTTSRNSNS